MELKELKKQQRKKQKVYGEPKLPHKIDAQYDNLCRGNLTAYYLDEDPARSDPVYQKLRRMTHTGTGSLKMWPNAAEQVAEYLQDRMESRRMDERTYRIVQKMPLWLLKLKFAYEFETNHSLRVKMDANHWYKWINDEKEWIDYKE